MILSGDCIHAREVIDFLKGIELGEEVWGDAEVVPSDIPFF